MFEDVPELPNPAAAAPPARPAGVSNAMYARLCAATAAAAVALQGGAAGANMSHAEQLQSLTADLAAEVSAYCVAVNLHGDEWARHSGGIFQNSVYRGTHWPVQKKTYPLLGICAWFVLSAFNANTITERANSVGRLVISYLRGAIRADDASKLVISKHIHRDAHRKKRPAAYLHPDIALMMMSPPAAPAGGGVAGVVAPLLRLLNSQTTPHSIRTKL